MKPTYYDEFSCIADRCSISCCQEWKIEVDQHTKKKWSSLQLENEWKTIDSYVRAKDGMNLIKLDEEKRCPFLNEKKLCKLVSQFGEEALSKTCTTFPRETKEFEDRTESCLVACCPEVVDMLSKLKEVRFTEEADAVTEDVLVELRSLLMELVADQSYSTGKAMMMCFYLLLDLYGKEEVTSREIESYRSGKILKELSDAIDNMEFSSINTFDENNELFLDLAVNYRKEKLYSSFLEPIAELAEQYSKGYDEDEVYDQIEEFEDKLASYEPLFRNYLVSELFNNGLHPESDLESMVALFQWIALEYAVIRHTVLLQWLLHNEEEIEYTKVRDSIVIISRMTGYEEDDIFEYLENSFQSILWDWGYLALLLGN
ncbi:MAG: flagellin lysine-N-methylase [bacterium]|nr:flagellin lysine-N-methylase [bacterium]